MPKTGKILKISILIILIVFILIFSIYMIFKINENNLVFLIGTGITGAIGLFISVFQILNKKDSEETQKQIVGIKKDVTELKSKVSYFDESLNVFDYTVKNMNEKQIAMDLGFIDISTSIKNKEKINHLCQRMESSTFEIFENHFDINSDFRDYIIQVIDGIGVVIKNQYEYGFDEFNPAYFKRKIIKRLDLVSKNSNVNKELLPKLTSSINKNICNYITDIDDIKYLVNGERRELFEKKTIAMTNKLSYHSIEIFKEEKK